jgi:hypothetical protein
MAQASKRKRPKKPKPLDEPLEEELEETNGEEEEEVPLPDEPEPVEEPDLGRITMAEPLTADERKELEELRAKVGESKAAGDPDKPVEERRGTTSPAGKFRLGSTITVPLTEGPEAVSKDDVIQRQKDLANELMGMLEGATDAEAKAFRDRLVSGNVDELELASMKAHLSDEAHQKAREKLEAAAQERAAAKAERDKQREEDKAARTKEREERMAKMREEKGLPPKQEGEPPPEGEQTQTQAYSGNEPR